MKRLLTTILVLTISTWAFAQGGPGGQRRSVEERVKAIHDLFEAKLKVEKANLEKIDAIFTRFYTDQDKVRTELMGSGERPDFEAMRAKMEPLNEARDKELKAILTEEQFKKWKEDLEPSMSPRRGGGGPRS